MEYNLLSSAPALAIWAAITITSSVAIFSTLSWKSNLRFAVHFMILVTAVVATFLFQVTWAYMFLVVAFFALKGWVIFRTNLRQQLERKIGEILSEEDDPEIRQNLARWFNPDRLVIPTIVIFILVYLGAYMGAVALNG